MRAALHLAPIVVERLKFVWPDVEEAWPFFGALIVDENVRLVEKANEAAFDSELPGGGARGDDHRLGPELVVADTVLGNRFSRSK